MNVSWVVSMTVMETLTASIPLAVTTAAVTLAMREMDSTAQVSNHVKYTTHCQWCCPYVAYLWFTVTRWLLFPDINECQLGTDLCMNAECNNTAGSYTCRPCFPGFIPGNQTTCSELYHTKSTIKLLFSIVLLSQHAQMVTSGWWMVQSHQWGRAEWRSATTMFMAASVMTSGTLLTQVWCAIN